MTPDQLQWILDHNMQIRGSHRVQIAEAVEAWRLDRRTMFTIMDMPVARVIADVLVELARAEKLHPNYPHDQVRRAAITAEEAGEVLRAALDLTRINTVDRVETLKTSLYTECKQTAAMAIRHMIALNGGEQ